MRLKIIGNLETMHDSDLPTFLIISLPIIFKRTVLMGVGGLPAAAGEITAVNRLLIKVGPDAGQTLDNYCEPPNPSKPWPQPPNTVRGGRY